MTLSRDMSFNPCLASQPRKQEPNSWFQLLRLYFQLHKLQTSCKRKLDGWLGHLHADWFERQSRHFFVNHSSRTSWPKSPPASTAVSGLVLGPKGSAMKVASKVHGRGRARSDNLPLRHVHACFPHQGSRARSLRSRDIRRTEYSPSPQSDCVLVSCSKLMQIPS